MQYIVHRRFKGTALDGEMNLPAFTVCEEYDGLIVCNDQAICFNVSENANQYFARNDDGKGIMRGKLTQAIMKKLAKRDDKYQERWDKIWEDPRCKRFKRPEHEDHWLWNFDFFHAEIEDLQYIAELIGLNVSKIA